MAVDTKQEVVGDKPTSIAIPLRSMATTTGT